MPFSSKSKEDSQTLTSECYTASDMFASVGVAKVVTGGSYVHCSRKSAEISGYDWGHPTGLLSLLTVFCELSIKHILIERSIRSLRKVILQYGVSL